MSAPVITSASISPDPAPPGTPRTLTVLYTRGDAPGTTSTTSVKGTNIVTNEPVTVTVSYTVEGGPVGVKWEVTDPAATWIFQSDNGSAATWKATI